jgi:predicted permease
MPDWKALVRARLDAMPLDPARVGDIVDELAQHVSQHYADLRMAGRGEDDAIREALQPLDNPAHLAWDIAHADRPRYIAPAPPETRGGILGGLLRDVGYATRLLRRAPGFAATALLTLALGIGANTAIFSVLNAVLLRPLPYADPERLVLIGERGPNGSANNVGYTTFLDWRDRGRGFEEMTLIRSWNPTLIANGQAERVSGMRVAANFFHTLGVKPAIGRDFTSVDDTPTGWQVVILSDSAWRRTFDADPGIVGRPISMNGLTFTVIGVMPPSFEPLISERFYTRADIWAPVGYAASLAYACRSCQHLKAIGRLKPGTTLEAARADVDAVQVALRREHPTDYAPSTMTLVPLRDALTGGIRPVLGVLMGAVAFVLLIACANVASLLLARIARRERDLALRAALGASRARIVRQLMVESGLLAISGGLLGLLMSFVTVPLLVHLAPSTMARLAGARMDGRALAFSLGLSLATAFLFGLLPAVKASRVNLQASLHGDVRKSGQAATSFARRLLVAADVAMAVVLLTGAGLMIKSVGRLIDVNPGFDPEHVLSMQISLVGPAYAKNDAVLARIDALVASLRALPGVDGAAAAGQIPLGGNGDTWGFHLEGRPVSPDDPSVERYAVTPGYFSVMRIPLLRGRLLADTDGTATENVMLIGEHTARTLWPGADPIGQHVQIGGDTGPWRTIVGIVGDVRHQDLATTPTMQMYLPQSQNTDSFLTLVIRTQGDPWQLANDARRAIAAEARDVPVFQIAPLTDLVERSIGPRRFVMVLLELFSGLALLMTAIGVYGVISYTVAERTREIGIRSALGAQPADIVRLVVGGGLTVVCSGLGAGLALAFAASRFLEGSLYGVSTTDPGTLAGVAVVLLVVALAAQVIPIVRAMRIDPTVALRED